MAWPCRGRFLSRHVCLTRFCYAGGSRAMCSDSIAGIKEKFRGFSGGAVRLQMPRRFRNRDHLGVSPRAEELAFWTGMTGPNMMCEFHDAAQQLDRWADAPDSGAKGWILRSDNEHEPAGKRFVCSGGDLKTVARIGTPSEGLQMSRLMHDTIRLLRNMPLVSVCLVNGRAIGGGAEMTLVTDYRLFTRSGQLNFVQGKMGVATGWGGGLRLVKLLGERQALRVLLTGEGIKADRAVTMGLCDDIVDEDADPLDWLTALIGQVDTTVIRAKKTICMNGARTDISFEEALKLEREQFAPLWGGPANKRALAQNIKHK